MDENQFQQTHFRPYENLILPEKIRKELINQNMGETRSLCSAKKHEYDYNLRMISFQNTQFL